MVCMDMKKLIKIDESGRFECEMKLQEHKRRKIAETLKSA